MLPRPDYEAVDLLHIRGLEDAQVRLENLKEWVPFILKHQHNINYAKVFSRVDRALYPLIFDLYRALALREVSQRPLEDEPEINTSWWTVTGINPSDPTMTGNTYIGWEPRSEEERNLHEDTRLRFNFVSHQTQMEDILQFTFTTLSELLAPAYKLTCSTSPREALFTTALVHLLPNPAAVVDQILELFLDKGIQRTGLFDHLGERLYNNLNSVSHTTVPQYSWYDREIRREHVRPRRSSQVSPEQLVASYLDGTPLKFMLLKDHSIRFDSTTRLSHQHILGGSGAGKSTLLKHMILNDLQSPEKPTIVVVDPHSELISAFKERFEEDVILIDPRDIHHPPALNIFDSKLSFVGVNSEIAREQMTSGVIESFKYLFGGLSVNMTGHQTTYFEYVASLMVALNETRGEPPTIIDLLRFVEDPTRYRDDIEQLPELERDFFLRDVLDPRIKTYNQTADQVRARLRSILRNPTMRRIFTAKRTELDLYDLLNSGKLILVDTAQDFLGKDNSAVFGRFFISLIIQALVRRAPIPEKDRKLTYLYVDEAGDYFDDHVSDLLRTVRKFRCGAILAHHELEQASRGLLAALGSSTAVKFVSQPYSNDAGQMAKQMRTTAEFIMGQPRFSWAAYIQGLTQGAISIPVGPWTDLPRLSPERAKLWLDRNRALVSLEGVPETGEPATRGGGNPPPEDEDISYG